MGDFTWAVAHLEFEKNNRQNPQLIAAQFGNDSLSYSDLNNWANKLAWRLIDAGVRAGSPVAVCLQPGLSIPIAILGILKAGGAYVPIAPSCPEKRIEFILGDVGTSLILTTETLREFLSIPDDGIEEIDWNAQTGRMDASAGNPDLPVGSDQLAYILFTSGSSGTPKAVEVTHQNLSYYLDWHCNHLRKQAGEIDLPLSSSICFAAAVTQLFTPLLLGRTLHILPAGIVHQPDQLFAWYAHHSDFGLYCVPTLWNELLTFAENEKLGCRQVTGPRYVLLSGEAVPEALVERSKAIWPNARMWNLYGPTEATANATAGELIAGQPVNLGAPINGSRLYLVDANMRQVSRGEKGEICICGPGVAKGYLNRSELTADRFPNNPFDDDCDERLFRTGDLAVINGHDELLFVGRKDFQVNIRGYRIECGEVEKALLQHPAVNLAVVDGRTDKSLERQLVAWITYHAFRYVSVAEIRTFLRTILPEYMIPERVVILGSMPTLANGKIDRPSLPHPGNTRPELGNVFVPPRNVRENILVRIWGQTLEIEGVGTDDDFFHLGGNSLKASSAIVRIAEELNAHVTFNDFFLNPTPSRISAIIGESKPAERDGGLEPVYLPSSSRGARPCGSNQRGLWLLTQRAPESTAYNMQFSLQFDGKLDLEALKSSIEDLIRRHDILRSVIRVDENEPVLVVEEVADIRIDTVDLRDIETGSVTAKIAHLKRVESERIFSLDRAPLYSVSLILCPQNRFHLLMTVHHVVFDGISINVFCDELIARYRAKTQGNAFREKRNTIQYLDYLASVERQLDQEKKKSLSEFWRNELEGSNTILNFPTDFTRPRLQTFHGARETLHLSAQEKEHLFKVSQSLGQTPFMAMFAAYSVLLQRYANQDDILVGCPVANRMHRCADGLIGFFTNTIALRTRPDREQSFRQLLAQVQNTCLKAFQHQSLPFEDVLKATQPERNTTHTPLFQVMFAYHESLPSGPVDEQLAVTVFEDGNHGAKYDFVADVHDLDQGMELRLTYNTDLFSADTMQRFLRRYLRLLTEVLERPDQSLGEFGIVSKEETRLVLNDWNETAVDHARNRCLHRLVEDQVEKTPERVAVVFGQQELTFEALNKKANQLARYLVARGVIRSTPVGVCLETSPDLIVALLAISKAGGAYVPLDPYYPRDRLAYIIKDSCVSLIISQDSLHNTGLQHAAEFIWVDLDAAVISRDSALNLDVPVEPDDLCNVMYTSGSTGRPKGVLVPHRGLCNFVLWMNDRFPLTHTDRVLHKASINFDISVWEIFLPLMSGAQLVLAKPEVLQAAESLAELIIREAITQIQFVPSALTSFVDSGLLPSCKSLQRIFSGGEALSSALQKAVFASFEGELHNFYGPTEASVYVCHWECVRGDKRPSVPIGRPIHNSKVYILDNDMRPAPIGVIGELFIGGEDVLARGYRNKPDETAAKFVVEQLAGNGEQERLFRTGDFARYASDGSIEFCGRADTQVKVRGYRIELAEIEHNLILHPEIKHAVVIVREDELGDHRLVAYLLYRNQSGPVENELRSHLKQVLPDYMVPSDFVELDSIPLLPNSKINVKALPKPSYRKRLDDNLERNYVSDHERTLAQIWEELLANNKFGLDDNFFDVGGHSLLMVKLQTMVRDRLQIEVSNIELFQFPTIRSLSERLKDSEQTNDRIATDMANRAHMRAQRVRKRHQSTGIETAL